MYFRHLENNQSNKKSRNNITRFLVCAILAFAGFTPLCAISTNANISEDITKAIELEPNIENGKKIYRLCATCHIEDGSGKKDGSFPIIAGQHRNVLIKQMADIRSKNRDNPTMFPFTNPEEIGGLQGISDVTAYIESMDRVTTPGIGDGKNVEIGKSIYSKHCVHCHGENAEGNNSAYFPALNGQHHAYLLRQMKWIRDGYRKNANEAMVLEVKKLSDEELDAVADYLSRLK